MAAHIALLRGINVGGRNRLPMKDLVSLFEEAGCRDVRSYIQSGNVLFRAGDAMARRIPRVLPALLAERFGLETPVITRTREELRRVCRSNPHAAGDERTLHVVFLADRPARSRAARLDPDRSPPDEMVLRGREIYLRCPNGIARTRLTNDYLDRTLATVSTIRNWRTTRKLLDLLEQESE